MNLATNKKCFLFGAIIMSINLYILYIGLCLDMNNIKTEKLIFEDCFENQKPDISKDAKNRILNKFGNSLTIFNRKPLSLHVFSKNLIKTKNLSKTV